MSNARGSRSKGHARLQKFIEPGMRSYFVFFFVFCAVLFAAAMLWGTREAMIICAAIGVLAGVAEFVGYIRYARKRRSEITRYIDKLASGTDAAKNQMRENPFPMAVVHVASGEVIWQNSKFGEMTSEREHNFEVRITDILPDFTLRWLADGMHEAPAPVEINGRWYTVCGSCDLSQGGRGMSGMVGTLYFVDCTEFRRLRELFARTRPAVGVLQIDNYDEITKNLTDTQKSTVLAEVDEKINSWLHETDHVLVKYDRDKYYLVCNRETLDKFVEDKFSVLDAVRTVVSRDIPVTLSIGFGIEGEQWHDILGYAELGLEMALSRGGDQAVVKNRLNFAFYGGKTQELERRTKVKSRVMANALSQLITDSSRVFIMGHSNSDLDSLGAAAGVVSICRAMGREMRIVIDRTNTAAGTLIDRLQKTPEYEDVFITPSDAMIEIDPRALLVIVDTNRPEVVESPELLETATRIAVIDHHRRAASYVENAALNLHEPYASSASELVCELITYTEPAPQLTRAEADALLAGIELDTKSFTTRTGVRTFEAAAQLRLAGADPTEIKKLFQTPLQQYTDRYRLTSRATLYREHVATVLCDEPEDRVTAAQAADELLNIAGVGASFVVFPSGDQVVISGRSLGAMNVQVICEKLGGGGHLNMAGAQVVGQSPEVVMSRLYGAIDEYLAEQERNNNNKQ